MLATHGRITIGNNHASPMDWILDRLRLGAANLKWIPVGPVLSLSRMVITYFPSAGPTKRPFQALRASKWGSRKT